MDHFLLGFYGIIIVMVSGHFINTIYALDTFLTRFGYSQGMIGIALLAFGSQLTLQIVALLVIFSYFINTIRRLPMSR